MSEQDMTTEMIEEEIAWCIREGQAPSPYHRALTVLLAARHMLEEIGSEVQQHYEYMSDNRPLPVLVSEILDNMEAARYDREQAEAKLSALYKGIRGLAMDSGAVQTRDAVDDVRRDLEEKDKEINRLQVALQESEADNVRLRSEWVPPDAYAEERTAREQAERELADLREELQHRAQRPGGHDRLDDGNCIMYEHIYGPQECPVCRLAAAQAVIEERNTWLAECYRLSGADPDGDEDWRLAPFAVAAVKQLRADHDELCEQVYGSVVDTSQQTIEAAKALIHEVAVAAVEHDAGSYLVVQIPTPVMLQVRAYDAAKEPRP